MLISKRMELTPVGWDSWAEEEVRLEGLPVTASAIPGSVCVCVCVCVCELCGTMAMQGGPLRWAKMARTL